VVINLQHFVPHHPVCGASERDLLLLPQPPLLEEEGKLLMHMVAEAAVVIGSSFVLSLAVKVTLVAASALIVTRIARRSRASFRHLVLASASLALLVLPFVASIGPSIPVEVPVMYEPLISANVVLPADAGQPVSDSRMTASYDNAAEQISIPVSTVIAALWVAGSVFFLLPMAAGLWQLRRVRRSGVAWRDGESMLRELADEIGIQRPVTLLLHEAVPGPMMCGILHPAIVFPPDAQSWNDADRRRAMIHELEHVRRRDCLIHGVARLVCAFYWFHPLVWMSWRRLGLEAERACDDAVLGCTDATEYADQLVTLAGRITPGSRPPLLAMAGRSDLRTRVAAVLDAGQRRGRPGALSVIGALAAVVLLITVISPLRAVGTSPERRALQVAGALPEFEVASIKPRGRSQGPYMLGADFQPGGRVSATNSPLFSLIIAAYNLSFKQLRGGHDVLSESFDLDARAGANSLSADAPVEVRNAQLRLMLQKLLADRFKLAIHKETIETPLYALVVAKNGPRLKPSPPDFKCPEGARCSLGGGPAGGIKGRNVEISELVDVLTAFADRPVLDRTGIHGRYDIDVPSWSRSPQQPPTGGELDGSEPGPNPLDPSLFVVLQEQLGLRLEAIRGPHDVYVVDHVERPAPN
jgi:uncharacterized protein (TIGR03435 family)